MSETVGNKTNFKIFWCVRNWKINLKETGWRKLNLEHRCFGRVRNTLMKINEKNFGSDRNILKKINEENFGRVKYSMIIFAPFLDLTGETLWILFACEKFELLSNQGCFENVSELFFEVKVEINYDFEVKKIHELTWNQDVFQNAPQSPFISTQDNKKVKVCFKVHTSLDIQISPHPTILMCSTSWALIRRKSDNESWDTVQTSKRLPRSLSSCPLLSKGKPPTTDSHNRELLETHCWMSQWLGCIQVLEFKLNHLQFHQPGKACL